MKIRNVLSLFDGISCGQLALKKVGIEYDIYYASEIDKNPIYITQYNFPKTVQLGDVEKWKEWNIEWDKIDLLIGGSPCFVAGTLVMTDRGMKSIEDIKVGDYVLTHKGRLRKVLNIGNKLSNTIYKLNGYGFKNILTTANHPFYSRSLYRKYVAHNISYKRCLTEPEWVKCENLDKNSYLATTYNKCFIENIKFNSDFWYFVGRFIGDGWVGKIKRKERKNSFIYQVILCCGKDEFEEVKIIMDKLGYNYSWSEERTTFKFRIFSKELEEYLIQVGIGAKNKCIHPDVWTLPKELKKAIIEGYLSADGSFDKNKTTYSYSTTSKRLAYEMKLLITEVYNVPVEVHYYDSRKSGTIEGRNVKYSPIFYCKFKLDKRKQDKAFFENDISWQPLKKCEIIDSPTIVYNLEVEEDNSYTADSIVVHNCTNLSIAGNRKGLEGEESRLFYSYVDILNHIKKFNPQVKFLLENVESMSDENKGIINNYMGCKPVMINSSLVSAQNRKRYYWVNWHLKKASLFGLPSCTIPQPEDKHILLKDILETGVASMDKSITLQATDYKGMGAKPIERLADGHQPRAYACEKVCYAGRIVGRPFNEDCKRTTNGNGNVVQIVEVNSDPNKSNTLSTVQKDNVICEPICVNSQSGRSDGKGKQPFVEDRIYSVDGKAVSLNTNWHQNVAEPVRIEESNNVESFCFKFERTDEGKKLRKDYESGKIHHKFNEHRILTPRTDNKTNTLTTIGKDNLICESLNNYVKTKYEQFSKKNGYIPEMFSPYNLAEVKIKSPTLTTTGCGPTNINGLLFFEKIDGNDNKLYRVYHVINKSVCLSSNKEHSGKVNSYKINLPDGDYIIRKLTPIECERLQTVPDNYTKIGFDGNTNVSISNSARYKALGNGWTVDVISYLFGFLKNEVSQ